ncbi:MAG: V-type ATP synthase subunit D [Pseudomonadota bacterium]
MSETRLTKIELKKQKDDLKRFRRYLPTLYIKQQLLQKEGDRINEALDILRDSEKKMMDAVSPWQALFCEPADLEKKVRVEEMITGSDNIAGVDIPVLKSVTLRTAFYDFLTTPLWVDEAVSVLKALVESRIRASFLVEQKRLLFEELRITSQRVNLFEKVKIPEAVDAINRIHIYLGDLETVAAGWARMAKKKI